MKNTVQLFIFIYTAILSNPTYATPVGSTFNYQGELMDSGQKANGLYNFRIEVFDDLNFVGPPLFFDNITVTNGIFNLPSINMEPEAFIGNEIKLKISVKKTSELNYSILNPQQRISAVPFATYAENSKFSQNSENAVNADTATFAENANTSNSTLLANSAFIAETLTQNGAQIGQYLQYKGQQLGWSPADIVIPNTSPWTSNQTTIYQNDLTNRVGIGVLAPNAKLHINGGASDETLFRAQSLGSTKFVVKKNGIVGVNEFNPSATLEVKATIGNSAMKIKSVNGTLMSIEANGNTIINKNLTVLQNSTVAGNVYQNNDSNGLPKYMITFNCSDTPPFTAILKQYNGTLTAGLVTIANANVNPLGDCTLTFPTSILNRYFSLTEDTFANGSTEIRRSNCGIINNNQIRCTTKEFLLNNGVIIPVTGGPFHLIIF